MVTSQPQPPEAILFCPKCYLPLAVSTPHRLYFKDTVWVESRTLLTCAACTATVLWRPSEKR